MKDNVRHFFWFCSGVNINNLKQFPSDWNKYASIGATVFLTALLASLTAGYAFYSVFQNIFIAFSLGVFWGIIVLNLDRYIIFSLKLPVSSIQKTSIFTYFPILPRIFLAVLLSFTIAIPFELRLFDVEIKQQLFKNLEQKKLLYNKQSPEIQAIEKLKLNFKSKPEVAQYEALLVEKIKLEAEYIKEVQGLTATKKYGDGPAAKAMANRLIKVKTDIEKFEVSYLKEKSNFDIELVKLMQKYENGQNLVTTLNNIESGFLQKIIALKQISDQYSIVNIVTWLLRLLIITLECAPLLVKLFSKPGAYDFSEAVEYNTILANYNANWLNTKNQELKKSVEIIQQTQSYLDMNSNFNIANINLKLMNFIKKRMDGIF